MRGGRTSLPVLPGRRCLSSNPRSDLELLLTRLSLPAAPLPRFWFLSMPLCEILCNTLQCVYFAYVASMVSSLPKFLERRSNHQTQLRCSGTQLDSCNTLRVIIKSNETPKTKIVETNSSSIIMFSQSMYTVSESCRHSRASNVSEHRSLHYNMMRLIVQMQFVEIL